MKRLLPVLLLLLAALYGVVALRPAWQAVVSAPHGRDYATYHYATLQALGDGSGTRGDPYDTAALGRLARAEHTRGTVHPYFYPPPFLLGMLWIAPPWRAPLSLAEGYRAWFWIQNACLLGVLIGLWRWFRAHPLLLGLLAVTFTPIPDNLKMGQANLPVLLLVVWGLAGRSGALVGAAAMAKMSPALYLVGWAAQRRWRPVLVAVATAVVLSLLTLPLVPLATQLSFYRDILPGFSTGDYHGLTVPISLPANHSIPDLFNQLWPGPDAHTLDPRAQRAGEGLSLGLLALLGLLARRRTDAVGEANLMGAFTVLLLASPVYTYEHHLALMLLPCAAVGQALLSRRLRWGWALLVLPAYFLVAWPLYWLRAAQQALPALSWWIQESKPLGMVGITIGCVAAVLSSEKQA